jgi:hypothetical protein
MERVLVVACRTAADDALLDAVARRAARSPCEFTLLVPAVAHGFHRVVDPEDACCDEARATIERLLPALEAAAGAPVASRIGAHEVFAAVQDLVNATDVDEIILGGGAGRLSRLLHLDLPRKIRALGVAVTAVDARDVAADVDAAADRFPMAA